jgi:hypothetical protein
MAHCETLEVVSAANASFRFLVNPGRLRAHSRLFAERCPPGTSPLSIRGRRQVRGLSLLFRLISSGSADLSNADDHAPLLFAADEWECAAVSAQLRPFLIAHGDPRAVLSFLPTAGGPVPAPLIDFLAARAGAILADNRLRPLFLSLPEDTRAAVAESAAFQIGCVAAIDAAPALASAFPASAGWLEVWEARFAEMRRKQKGIAELRRLGVEEDSRLALALEAENRALRARLAEAAS